MRRSLTVPSRVIALCALTAGAAACTTSGQALPTSKMLRTTPTTLGHATQRASTPAPGPAPGVDLHSASAVAIAVVEATWTLNTMVDAGWYAGELAASAYMTPRYAASIRQNRGSESPGATWMAWAAHRVVTSVSAHVEADPGGPMSTAFTAYRLVIATVTPHGTATTTDTATSSDPATSIGTATSNDAGTPDDPATPVETQATNSTAGWVGQSEVWVTYLVLSRTSLGAPWRVALSETTQ
jgi:hypothetical protein